MSGTGDEIATICTVETHPAVLIERIRQLEGAIIILMSCNCGQCKARAQRTLEPTVDTAVGSDK